MSASRRWIVRVAFLLTSGSGLWQMKRSTARLPCELWIHCQEALDKNIPVIEEGKDRKNACDQITRRIICLQLTPNPEEVDHAAGIYAWMLQDELQAFLLDPLTH